MKYEIVSWNLGISKSQQFRNKEINLVFASIPLFFTCYGC